MRPEYQHQIDDLLHKIEHLEAVVRSQQQTIEVRQERIKQLESALAAAKKNSSNSSKPPSSDIVASMKGVCHASYSTIRKFLRDVVGIRIQIAHSESHARDF